MGDAPPAVHGGTIKLPLIGTVPKKAAAIGALVGGGVIAYVVLRKRSAAGAAATAANTSTATADPNLDPATGFDYGTPQDVAALNSNAGSAGLGVGSGIGLGGGVGAGEFFDPNTGQFDLSQPFTGGTATPTVTTNAEWEQEAIADLQAGGVSQATISNAEAGLPRYLAHLTLSPAQASAVQIAVGLAGPPPTGGPYAIRQAPEPPASPKVTVPKVTGKSYDAASAELGAHGLHARRAEPDVGTVTAQDPAAGARVHKGATVVLSGKGATPVRRGSR